MRPAGLAAAVLLLGACSGEPGANDDRTLPSQVVEGFVLHENASGARLYTLSAETAYVHEVEGVVDVAAPVVLFYDELGEVYATLVAERGTVNSNTDDLVARGSVVVRTEDSTLLRTDSLAWNNTVRQVRTDAAVEVETPNGRVAGTGLVSDAALSNIQILSEVTGSSDYRFDAVPDSR